ncbi:MAG: hypothetical protein ACFFCI_12335, partial [Promethearchaeota archaeon]
MKNVYYCTHSNLDDLSYGDSNNDNKFISSIPSEFNVVKIFPVRNKDNYVNIFSFLKLILRIIFLATKKNQIFVIRGTRLGIIPAFFKQVMKHTILLNVGCTPFSSIEKIAFSKNPSYKSKSNLLINIFLKLDFQFEKFVIRHSTTLFVENVNAGRIAKKYGGSSLNIVLLPYYVQDYFLTTKAANYNFSEGKPLIIGYTGRFHKYDKLEPLIDAVHILKNIGFPIILKLVGDGPTKKIIQEKVNNYDLNDNV